MQIATYQTPALGSGVGSSEAALQRACAELDKLGLRIDVQQEAARNSRFPSEGYALFLSRREPIEALQLQ